MSSEPKSYAVSYSPTAWSKVGTLRSEDFDSLVRALGRLAQAASQQQWSDPAEFKRGAVRLKSAEVTARYFVDHLRRCVTLVDVEPQESSHADG